MNNLLDQTERVVGALAERVVGALAESDERHVGTFSRSGWPDVIYVDLTGDHLVPEGGNDRREQR
jgi:hypothetical protein